MLGHLEQEVQLLQEEQQELVVLLETEVQHMLEVLWVKQVHPEDQT